MSAAQHLGGGGFSEGGSGIGKLPSFAVYAFSTALSQSMYLPAAILLIGVVASALFVRGGRPTPDTIAEASRTPVEVEHWRMSSGRPVRGCGRLSDRPPWQPRRNGA